MVRRVGYGACRRPELTCRLAQLLVLAAWVGTASFAVVGAACWALAEEGGERRSTTREAEAMRYVRQLGSPEYRKREAAAAWLLKRDGAETRRALLAGLQMPDLETRLRAREILQQLQENGFEARLAAFIAGSPGAVLPPNWNVFKKFVGDTRETRELYAEMLRRHGDLLGSVRLEHGLSLQDQKRITDALDRLHRTIRMRRMQAGLGRVSAHAASIGTFLFLTHGDFVEGSNDMAMVTRLYSLNSYGALALNHPALGKLLDAWAMSRPEGYGQSLALELCVRLGRMKTAVAIARQVLQSSTLRAHQLFTPCAVLAKNGDLRDLPLLERHLDNTTVIHTHHNRRIQKEPIRIRAQDAILALAIHMTGQRLEDYFYKHARADRNMLYYVYTLFFLSDEDRTKAFEKWHAWRKSEAARRLLREALSSKGKGRSAPKGAGTRPDAGP